MPPREEGRHHGRHHPVVRAHGADIDDTHALRVHRLQGGGHRVDGALAAAEVGGVDHRASAGLLNAARQHPGHCSAVALHRRRRAAVASGRAEVGERRQGGARRDGFVDQADVHGRLRHRSRGGRRCWQLGRLDPAAGQQHVVEVDLGLGHQAATEIDSHRQGQVGRRAQHHEPPAQHDRLAHRDEAPSGEAVGQLGLGRQQQRDLGAQHGRADGVAFIDERLAAHQALAALPAVDGALAQDRGGPGLPRSSASRRDEPSRPDEPSLGPSSGRGLSLPELLLLPLFWLGPERLPEPLPALLPIDGIGTLIGRDMLLPEPLPPLPPLLPDPLPGLPPGPAPAAALKAPASTQATRPVRRPMRLIVSMPHHR